MGGDLYVRITIEDHKIFTRKGADLFLEKKITLLEALTGFNFELTHLDGLKFKVQTLPGECIGHKDIKVIKEKGMPFYKDPMS
jgi:DnaJ family protein A protein 2